MGRSRNFAETVWYPFSPLIVCVLAILGRQPASPNAKFQQRTRSLPPPARALEEAPPEDGAQTSNNNNNKKKKKKQHREVVTCTGNLVGGFSWSVMPSIFEALSFLFETDHLPAVVDHDTLTGTGGLTAGGGMTGVGVASSQSLSQSSPPPSASKSSSASSSNSSRDGITEFSEEYFLVQSSDESILPDGSIADPNLIPFLVKSWDVKVSPISMRQVCGKMIPTVQSAARPFWQRERRLTIEVHGIPSEKTDPQLLGTVHEDLRRRLLQGRPFMNNREGRDLHLHEHDIVVIRFYKHMAGRVFRRYVRSVRRSGRGEIASEEVSSLGIRGANEDDDDFDQMFCYRLGEIAILKQVGRFCELRIGTGNQAIVRGIKFIRERDATAFVEAHQRMKMLERQRRQA